MVSADLVVLVASSIPKHLEHSFKKYFVMVVILRNGDQVVKAASSESGVVVVM